jgi:hypothetical protein
MPYFEIPQPPSRAELVPIWIAACWLGESIEATLSRIEHRLVSNRLGVVKTSDGRVLIAPAEVRRLVEEGAAWGRPQRSRTEPPMSATHAIRLSRAALILGEPPCADDLLSPGPTPARSSGSGCVRGRRRSTIRSPRHGHRCTFAHPTCDSPIAAVMASSADDFVEAFHDPIDLLHRGACQPPSDAVHGERPDLTDAHPGTLRQARGRTLERQRKAGTGFLAGQGHGNDGAGSLIEDIVADNQHGPAPGLFSAADRIEVGPADFPS